MNLKSYYRSLFVVGALWNWGATLFFFIAYKPLYAWLNMRTPDDPIYLQLFLGLCFVYGIGYFLVSRDINANHGIVIMGIIGKIIVFIGFVVDYLTGNAHLLIVLCGTVDLIFALLFIEFLMRIKKITRI